MTFARALKHVEAQLREMRCELSPFGGGRDDHAIYDLKRATSSGYPVRASLQVTNAGRGRLALEMTFQARRQPFRRLRVTTGGTGASRLQTEGGRGFETVFLGQNRRELAELCRYDGSLDVDGLSVTLLARLPGPTDLRRTVAAMVQLWRRLKPNGSVDSGERHEPQAAPAKRTRRPRPRNDTPAKEEADRLLGWVNTATTPWSSTCERVRETVEARVQRELQVGAPLRGRVVIAFASVGTRLDKLGLRATLDVPRSEGALKLSPQKGLGGFFARWREDTVGDAPVDDAFIIHLGDYPKLWLLAHRRELLALAPFGLTLQQATGHLVMTLDHLGTRADDVQPAVIAALKLWDRWVEQVVGG